MDDLWAFKNLRCSDFQHGDSSSIQFNCLASFGSLSILLSPFFCQYRSFLWMKQSQQTSLSHVGSQRSPQDFPFHHQRATQSKKKKNLNSGNLSHHHFCYSRKPQHKNDRGATPTTTRFERRVPPGPQDASKVWRICIRSWITVHVGSNGRSGWFLVVFFLGGGF